MATSYDWKVAFHPKTSGTRNETILKKKYSEEYHPEERLAHVLLTTSTWFSAVRRRLFSTSRVVNEWLLFDRYEKIRRKGKRFESIYPDNGTEIPSHRYRLISKSEMSKAKPGELERQVVHGVPKAEPRQDERILSYF